MEDRVYHLISSTRILSCCSTIHLILHRTWLSRHGLLLSSPLLLGHWIDLFSLDPCWWLLLNLCHCLIDNIEKLMLRIPLLMVACHDRSISSIVVWQTLSLCSIESLVNVDLWWLHWIVLWQDDLHWNSITALTSENKMVCLWFTRELKSLT